MMYPPESAMARVMIAADRAEIVELSARFDNALDAAQRQDFLEVFTPDGVLAGFWGEAIGPEEIGGAFDFMLATFARNRRHMVTNHVVTLAGDTARMFSYMVVHDRAENGSIGTATFTDALVRTAAGWRFTRRTLAADANVDPLIAALPAAG